MRAAEFFAGIGLVRMALERVGAHVVFANDIDPRKQAMYVENFGDDDFKLGDIREISGSSIPDVDIATASFPCIDLSLAGSRAGLGGAHSAAFWEFERILQEMNGRRPPYVLIENVLGLLTSDRGQDLERIVLALNALGYACDLLVVNAADFVPQSRPRLFIVGSNSAVGQSLTPHEARPNAVVDFQKRRPHLKWFSCYLPKLQSERQPLARLLERFPDDSGVWWDERRKAHLWSQVSLRHREALRVLMESRRRQYVTVYKRVRPTGCMAELRLDGLAGCLRTPRGGSSKQFLIQAGNERWAVRNMTAREYARLQGVPDSFVLSANENTSLFGFGDAVCVPAVEWVLRGMLAHQPEFGPKNQHEFSFA